MLRHRRRRILNHIKYLYSLHADFLLDEEEYLKRILEFGATDRFREGPPLLVPNYVWNIRDVENECETHFRFSCEDILFLAEVLELPEVIRTPAPVLCDRVTALAIVLKRLAFPIRIYDLAKFFNR